MIKSDIGEDFIADITSLCIEPGEIIQSFMAHPKYDPDFSFTIMDYHRHFFHIIVDMAIKTIATKGLYPELLTGVIPQGVSTDKYKFITDSAGKVFANSHRKVVFAHPDGNDYFPEHTEKYDHVVKLGDLYLVIDATPSIWGSANSHRRRTGVKNIVDTKSVSRKLNPLRDFLQQDVAYAVVCHKDVYHMSLQSEQVEIFEQSGGIYDKIKYSRGHLRGLTTRLLDHFDIEPKKLVLNGNQI
jgi:hypothetical protein|tara:strand:- start:61 stop:786 length:726 start_codon:yes stop_codon:yes gene_type:complete